jgi:hypothetical protein
MITGDLNFTTTDVSIMPYLCGFESQITGTLSPWCGVFTDAELKQYEYSQDLRYYYGMGPGTDLPSKMMLPYLSSLVGLLAQGPEINGTYANGTSYTLPKIITAFMNDGQITELGAVTGIWDNTTVLSGTEIPEGYEYISSHFVSMRGTVAFERLNCAVSPAVKPRGVNTEEKTVTITICPTQTGVFATYTKPAQSSSTSALTETKVYTITSCAPEITNCPIGKKTSTVFTSETVVPIEETSTSTAWQSWTTSTTLVTSSYTVTSCAPTVTSCSVGELTSTIYDSVTWCPVTATETGVASTSTGLGVVGSGSSSGPATKTSVSSRSSSNSRSTPTSTASATFSGSSNSVAISATLSATISRNKSCKNNTSVSHSLSGTVYTYPTTSATGIYNTASSLSSFTSVPYTNATSIRTYSNSTSTSSLPTSTPTSGSTNQTYIRILINDAVYVVPSCQDGPGRSCLLSKYVALIEKKVADAGDLRTRCNVTNAASPTVLKGASFFTNLADSWLAEVAP